jgi:hypothetical protein
MKSARRHLTFANVASLLALVFSMSGGALAARHYLINSTGQINPKVLKKLKGTPGEIGPIGPQGPTGLTGSKGSTGGRGEPAPSLLATGASESGDFGVRGNVTGGSLAESVTFRIPLAATIAKAQVVFTEAGAPPVEHCAGPGLADKGYLCVYATTVGEVGAAKSFDAEGSERLEGSGRLGLTLEVPVTGAKPAYEGTYTVTGS